MVSHVGMREKHKQILNTLKAIHTNNTKCPLANAPGVFTEFPGTFVSSRGWEDKPCVPRAAMQKREEEKHERRIYLVKKKKKN